MAAKGQAPGDGGSARADGVGALLDELDSGIVRALQEDGRRPYRQIARALGVSEGTVRGRARRLMASGALRVIAVADPFQLGYRVLAFVLLRVTPGEQARVIETLGSWDEVTYVSACAGRIDVYIQVVCRDADHLWDLLSARIPGIGGVLETETFMELKMHKMSYVYPAVRAGGDLPV